MDMQVMHRLSAVAAAVRDESVAVVEPQLARQ
jgi:hypothetical protein